MNGQKISNKYIETYGHHHAVIYCRKSSKIYKNALVSKKAQKTLLQDSSADFDFGHF